MRAPQTGDVVEVEPMVAYPGVGLLVDVYSDDRYPYIVRVFRPSGDFKVSVSKVHRCIVNFAGVVRL
jgi:hypothetical protein